MNLGSNYVRIMKNNSVEENLLKLFLLKLENNEKCINNPLFINTVWYISFLYEEPFPFPIWERYAMCVWYSLEGIQIKGY